MGRKKRKAKQGPNRQPKASEPKFGRSDWAFKPRDVSKQEWLRGVRKRFALLPFSKTYWGSQAIVKRGVENLTDTEKRNFLTRNSAIAAKAIETKDRLRGGRIASAKNLKRVIAKRLDKIEGKELDTWVRETINAIVKAETSNMNRLAQKVTDHAKKYFKARKIPVRTESEKTALNLTLDQFFRKGLVLNKPLDLAWIEQAYLKNRSAFKRFDQEDAVYRNILLRETFGHERLTANQRRVAKKWLQANLPGLWEEKRTITKRIFPKVLNKSKPENVEQAIGEFFEAEERFKERAKTELLEVFRGKKKQPAEDRWPSPMQKVKFGTRTQRMAVYRSREKTGTEKKNEMRKQALKVNLAGKPFDSAAFALEQIALESRPTAAFLKGLLDKRLLKRGNLTRLFTSGSLTQRLFRTVVNDPEFRNRFGINNIDLLARGLAFIGPTGKPTAKAIRAFQGEKGKKLFEFLAGSGFIDTRHGKGMTVTYLARLKGQ